MQRMAPHLALVGALGVSATVLALHALALPAALVLPALSAWLMIAALGIAALARICGADRTGARVTYWDISGGLYFIGCCAAALSETEGVLALMEEIKIRR